MYERFFGFKERPFQLVPNPAYLFLSRSHEEALAHLAYALSQGDGFVEITGEVGTGKTTLCRVFLENLTKNIEAAYIFNPPSDAIHLLKAINEEFGIDGSSNSLNTLISLLNAFLISKKREGKKAILLIDEAQNLNPAVLEQLRLLSNLETSTSKLIQIILVGQPELRDKLDSKELRQLSQRITVSCHLSPLVYHETRDYIQHRIRIAAQRSGVKFTRSAIKAIHRYSMGIPRLINIAADRALLTAYGLNHHKITGAISKAAVRELAYRRDVREERTDPRRMAIWGALAVLLILAAVSYEAFFPGTTVRNPSSAPTPEHKVIRKPVPAPDPPPVSTPRAGLEKTENAPPADSNIPAEKPTSIPPKNPSETGSPPPPATGAETSPPPDANPAKPVITTLSPHLLSHDPVSSRQAAVMSAMKQWQTLAVVHPSLAAIPESWDFFRLASTQNAFSIIRLETDLETLRRMNLPAILEFHPRHTGPVYLTLTAIREGGVILHRDQTEYFIAENDLKAHWGGVAFILWKNYLGLSGVIPRDATTDAVITLKMLLKDIGFTHLAVNGVYDEDTRNAVKTIQQKHGIPVDGAVGPITKIVLYNEVPSLTKPQLVKP